MTASLPEPRPAVDRSADLRLAHLHLRGGTYALARAELETLAGADRLDRDAVLDLAEVRWRTGDLPGAAAAAMTWLEEGDAAGAPLVLAHVICAEAAAERGRADEAAVHVEAASAGLGDRETLDAILAGIAARAAWPWGGEAIEGQGRPESARLRAEANKRAFAVDIARRSSDIPATRRVPNCPRQVPRSVRCSGRGAGRLQASLSAVRPHLRATRWRRSHRSAA
jgi:hypothetical protein